MAIQYTTLFIRGVPDADRAATIKSTLQQFKGVRDVNINWRMGTGDISFDNEQTNIDVILKESDDVVPGYRIETCEDDACSS